MGDFNVLVLSRANMLATSFPLARRILGLLLCDTVCRLQWVDEIEKAESVIKDSEGVGVPFDYIIIDFFSEKKDEQSNLEFIGWLINRADERRKYNILLLYADAISENDELTFSPSKIRRPNSDGSSVVMECSFF